jgi:hypothetical protein
MLKQHAHKGKDQMRSNNNPRGIYISFLQFVLELWILIPLWSSVKCVLKDNKKFTMTIQKKLHPAVAEVYQLVMLAIITVALWQMPNSASHPWWWSVFLIVALYRAWEILVIGIKWLLVDNDPLHSYRRSLVCFGINLLEISIIYTIAGYSIDKAVNGQQFWQVLKNVGKAFKLEMPPLDAPYAVLFSIEAALIIVFVLACVIGGIQRRT